MHAVYPGTFDPFTNGHLDVVRRGLDLFGELTVAVADGGRKKTLFTVGQRVKLIQECVHGLEGLKVVPFNGTVVDFLAERQTRILLRGLRTLSDYDYEVQMALFNRELDPRVETVFVVSSPGNAAINSSLVKEVAAMGRDVSSFVPVPVLKALQKRLGKDMDK